MIFNRFKYETTTPTHATGDVNNAEGEVHVDVQSRDYDVSTYGGEYSHHCDECGDIDLSYYGIQIDDFTLEISAKTALSLHYALKAHLETVGHRLYDFGKIHIPNNS